MDIILADQNNLDLSAWQKLADTGSFFHTRKWIDACLRGLGKKAEAVYFCGLEGDDPVVGMPAVVISKSGFKSLLSLPFGTYGSALFRPDIHEKTKKEFIDYVIQYLNKERYSLVEIVDYNRQLEKYELPHFERLNRFTHLVDLKKSEEFKPADTRVERHIRSGQKHDVEIGRIDHLRQIDEFYRIYESAEKRHGRSNPMYGIKFFQTIFEVFRDSDALYWIAATHENRMIGSQINFIHGDALFYWQGVMDYESREYKPAYLLMHESIDHAVRLGLSMVNLGASPPGANGLIEYKESWGAEKRGYFIYRRRSLLRRMVGR